MSLNAAKGHSNDTLYIKPDDGATPDDGDKPASSEDGFEVANKDEWVHIARSCYRDSTEYFDASVRRATEQAYDHFHNRHLTGSKYYSDAYKLRNKSFRPKSRAMVRNTEAAANIAFFSTRDLADIAPEDDSNVVQRISAKLHKQLLNIRLNEHMPWFMTCLGALQTAEVTGSVFSKQHWGGKWDDPTKEMAEIELRPIENLRFSPACDWRDPVGTSPYWIDEQSWYVYEVKERMIDPGEEPEAPGEWYHYDDSVLLSAKHGNNDDSTRRAREGRRGTDPQDTTATIHDYETIWLRENFVRKAGQEWHYFTLASGELLSKPVPIGEVYLLGERPYARGVALIEANRVYPEGKVGLVKGLQQDANEINNQRRDNVAFALNKRVIVRKGAKLNYHQIFRNTPGSIVETTDINADMKTENVPDVTGSSYQEQDRVNADFDEIGGSFSPGSVMTNRALNETVGGMEMIKGGSNTLTELDLKVFAMTWAEPVLRQLVKLHAKYETDEAILIQAASEAGVLKQIEEMGLTFEEILQESLKVTVDMGQGSTEPQQRVQRLSVGLGTIASVFPDELQKADFREIANEVFGALGYQNAERFFPHIAVKEGEEQSPELIQAQEQIEQLTAMLEEMQQALQTDQANQQAAILIEKLRQFGKDKDRETSVATAVMEHENKKVIEMIRQKGKIGDSAMRIAADKQQFANEVALKAAGGPLGNYGLEGPGAA